MLGYSSSRSQRGNLTSYKEAPTHVSRNSLDLVPIDMKKSRAYEFKPHGENPQPQKSRVGTMTFPKSSEREPLDSAVSSSSYSDKAVRFDDKVYPNIGPLSNFPGDVRHQRDTDGARPTDSLVRAPGNGDMNGELLCGGGHRKSLPKRSRADERQRRYIPAAPIIPRLPTPDFDSASHHELGIAKYDFCPCCTSYDERREGGVWCKKGKSKMDKQGMAFFFTRVSVGV